MGFETDDTLGRSQPPNLILGFTSPNVDGWQLEQLLLPTMGENAFTRRMCKSIFLISSNSPTTEQFSSEKRVASHVSVFTEGNQRKSMRVLAVFYRVGLVGNNFENVPCCQWINPFDFPLRGGDRMEVLVPGDADATPVQDWELTIELGPELRPPRPG